MQFDVDDIIAQHLDNDDMDNGDDDDGINLNVDDLLKDDLTQSVLSQSNDITNYSNSNPNDNPNMNQSPNPFDYTNELQLSSSLTPTSITNNTKNKPQLSSTLPPPIAPKTDENNVPDLPSTPSRFSISTNSSINNIIKSPNAITTDPEHELDIETILKEEEDDLDITLMTTNSIDPLLEFDPMEIGIVCSYIYIFLYILALLNNAYNVKGRY